MNTITGITSLCCETSGDENIEAKNITVTNDLTTNHITTESITVNQYAQIVQTLEIDHACIAKNDGYLYKDAGNTAHKNHHINYGTVAYQWYSFNPFFNTVAFMNNGNIRPVRAENIVVGSRFKLCFSLRISDLNNPSNNTTGFGVRFNGVTSPIEFTAPTPNLFQTQYIKAEIDLQVNATTSVIISASYLYYQSDGNHRFPVLSMSVLNFGSLVGSNISIEPYYRILTGTASNVTFARYDLSLFQYV